MRVARSASGEGDSPSASSFASTKRSIGFRNPSTVLHGGFGRSLGSDESPVRGVIRPFPDPTLQPLLLLGRKPPVRLRRRHQFPGIRRVDPRDEFAGARVLRNDRTGLDRRVANVEPQLGLTLVRVLPMAIEAVFREDGPDVAVELEGGRLGLSPVLECGQNRTALQDERDKKSERIPCRPLSFRLHLGPQPEFPISFDGDLASV